MYTHRPPRAARSGASPRPFYCRPAAFDEAAVYDKMRASEGQQIPTSKPRLEALDSLRGISALMVVLYHSSFPNFVHDLPVVRSSYLFVDFFFVLSGFIMYYNYKSLAGSREFGRFIGLDRKSTR